jgi:hypothetical protein
MIDCNNNALPGCGAQREGCRGLVIKRQRGAIDGICRYLKKKVFDRVNSLQKAL